MIRGLLAGLLLAERNPLRPRELQELRRAASDRIFMCSPNGPVLIGLKHNRVLLRPGASDLQLLDHIADELRRGLSRLELVYVHTSAVVLEALQSLILSIELAAQLVEVRRNAAADLFVRR